MAVKIRLKKLGRRHRPFFRVCAMDVRAPRDGRVIEELGTYDPMVTETDARAILNGERIDYWLSVGAKATPKVSVLIKKYGKDGTHMNEQQAALNKLAARRSDAIAAATTQAAADAEAAQAAAKKAAEEKAAEEKAAAEAAAAEAEAAAKEEASDSAGDDSNGASTEANEASQDAGEANADGDAESGEDKSE